MEYKLIYKLHPIMYKQNYPLIQTLPVLNQPIKSEKNSPVRLL